MAVFWLGQGALIQNTGGVDLFIIVLSRIRLLMALTSGQKAGYSICLILTILLVGLHYTVANYGLAFGQVWESDDAKWNTSVPHANRYLYRKSMKSEASFLIIAASLTLIISAILLVGLCTNQVGGKFKHVLAAFNLILEFAIAVVLALRATNNSNLRDTYDTLEDDYNDFKLFYRLTLADCIITFVLQFIYLFVIFFGTLEEVLHSVIIEPVVAEVPPLSNQRF